MSPHLLRHALPQNYPQRKAFNLIMYVVLFSASIIALIPLLSVFVYVISHGFSGINLDFFTQIPKPVGETGGGIANAIVGTLTLIALASLVGIPWGIAIGIYLSEYGKGPVSHWVKFSTNLLASIPSIIIGLFVYTLVVAPMKRFSAIAGGIALAILMIPTVARSVEELLKMVPIHIREAGLALGLPRWKVILKIVLTGSVKGIITGIMLSIARIAGETAPLLFTAFGNRFWQQGLDQPIASIPLQIYTYAISPYEDWHSKAWAGALILVLLVFVLNLTTRLLFNPKKRTNF